MTNFKFGTLLLLSLLVLQGQAKTLNSLTIAQDTLSAASNTDGHCLQYKMPTQLCVWWSPFVGRNVTPVLDHYLPDLVVAVYRNPEDDPWVEAKTLFDKSSVEVQKKLIHEPGSGNHTFLDEHEKQVIFKEAEVIGNPGLIALPNMLGYALLPSTATPMQPYFHSMVDSLLWRGMMPEALPEEMAALALNISHHIGRGFTDWGGVYPHEGTVMGNNDLKASMVIAYRAVDLLTNQKTVGHIRQTISESCGKHCKVFPMIENSKETLFQMIYPKVQNKCTILGSTESYSDQMLNDEGIYVWIVWRHYQGCADGEGKFIKVVP